jgi:hypothetical protein
MRVVTPVRRHQAIFKVVDLLVFRQVTAERAYGAGKLVECSAFPTFKDKMMKLASVSHCKKRGAFAAKTRTGPKLMDYQSHSTRREGNQVPSV